ncbi:MAG: signal recognition particle-docking protein FtsY [Pseudomonadota bacterium]|nr:signal recognition particle-docking protein FtsY [Pseudomonadota bacterium]
MTNEKEINIYSTGNLISQLKNSSSKFISGLKNIIGGRKIDDVTLQKIEDLMILADFGPSIASSFRDKLTNFKNRDSASLEEIKEIIAQEIKNILEPFEMPISISTMNKPNIILVVGINGSGKTTTIGKLAYLFYQKYKVSVIAGDTFRAAATEQLEKVTNKHQIQLYKSETGKDSSATIYESLMTARKNNDDIVIIDTAGRLHNNTDLMAELEKIVRVIKKIDPSGPHSTVLTVDSTIGQNAYSQVSRFKSSVGVNGLIITKLDGSSKGGSLIGITDKFHLPIHYVGIGEKIDQIEPFNAKEFSNSLLEI